MNPWMISYDDFNLSNVRLRETLFTLGNGYFSTRGALEDSISEYHYPGTYLAGVYNRLTSEISNQNLTNEDLVNQPNWLPLTFKIDEEWFDISKVTLLSYRETLHLKKGLVKRFYRFKDSKGRIFLVNSLRFVSQHDPHLAGIRYSITSENWSGKISVRSSIIGDIQNRGVSRYQDLKNQHLEILKKGGSSDFIYLQTRTSQSHIVVSQAIRTEIFQRGIKVNFNNYIEQTEKNIHQYFDLYINPYEKITIYKVLAIHHSKDFGIFENLYESIKKINEIEPFKILIKNHILSWSNLWNQFDIEISSTLKIQKLTRFHIFHILQSISKHSISLDYGAPARGLHGEAYRGHVFWDEIYILPFFFFSFPEIARSLLMYRYHRLNVARKLALKNGYKGAMFPWQSASNGEEETQEYHLNPQSNQWGPDFSRYQRHVNMAIVYNIWNYYLFTQDIQFLKRYGAEIIIEIAKFISSIVSFNKTKNKYEIMGVMGPDEYHECDLNSKPGLKNNTYTNIMAVWVLEKALELKKILSPLQQKYLFDLLNITSSELDRWEDITSKMFIPFHNQVLSQFEGYENLKEFEWENYLKQYGKFERLDRILKAEGKDPNMYQIAKQPDTLMLFYLFEKKELKRIFKKLNYILTNRIYKKTLEYYLKRTSHGSTLSKITCASILLKEDINSATHLYEEALVSDIEDTQGGTTQEGIHLGVMVGTLSILTQNFSGLKIKKDKLSLNPQLPFWIKRLKFKIEFQNTLFEIEIFPEGCAINIIEQTNKKIKVYLYDKLIKLSFNNSIYIEKSRRNKKLKIPINSNYTSKIMISNEENIN